MLNLVIKKINPYILKSIKYYNSSFTTYIDGWIEIPQNDNIRTNNNRDKKINKYQLLKKIKGQSHDTEKATEHNIFENQLFAGVDFAQIKEDDHMDLHQKKNINKKVVSERILDQEALELFHGNLSKLKISKFCRTIDAASRMKNSSKIVETICCLFKQNEQKQFIEIVKNYILSEVGTSTQKLSQKPTKAQKQLFKKTQNLFLSSIQEPDAVRELMKLFSQCNPNFIQIEQINKNSELHKSNDYLSQKKVSKYDLMMFQIQEKEKKGIKLTKTNKNIKNNHNQATDLINSFQKQNTTQNKTKTRELAKLKLFIKKQNKELIINEENLQKAEKSIFGNKKMITQHIIFKRVQNKENQKYNKYGKNWVYAYDLPYNFNQQQAQQLLCIISDKYGQIQEYSGQSYENFVQKNQNQVVYVIPQNYAEDNFKNRIKIQKIVTKISDHFQRENIKQMLASKKKQKKSLVTKILQKTQKQKDLALNKSTMVFKFKNFQDKLKFLTPQMRLYGLNIQKMRNIRFQQAQSKNVVALSMVPWACQSADLLKFINDTLIPLKIVVSHPNCIIANGYVFLELSNFYEALYAKDLLNNIIFQNQRLKAQLCYGSSHVYKGQYKFNFEFDHYETLVNKLTGLRDQYKEIHQKQNGPSKLNFTNLDFNTNLFDKRTQI